MTTPITRYKVLTADGQSAHGGSFTYPLPHGDTPGEWTPEITDPVICRRGYHLSTNPMQWPIVGMRVFEAEAPDPAESDADKSVHTTVRLTRERPDLVPAYWRAVERFVTVELPAVPWFQQTGAINPAWRHYTAPTWGAARAAARAAAWDAAGVAAGDAARAAAGDAAGVAARAAARAAAWAAAGVAAWDAALFTIVAHVSADLPIAEHHHQHVRDRWAVWQAGYALYADVNGTLYTYGLENA